MKPVVFVDIDGVLNTPKNYAAWYAAHGSAEAWVPAETDPYVLKLFDVANVRALNVLCERTGAAIVISSSWRMFYRDTIAPLLEVFVRAGVTAEVLGATPVVVPEREFAIESWLLGTGEKSASIVILDDLPSRSFGKLTSWVVKTDPQVGFVDCLIEDAINVMKRPWERSEGVSK